MSELDMKFIDYERPVDRERIRWALVSLALRSGARTGADAESACDATLAEGSVRLVRVALRMQMRLWYGHAREGRRLAAAWLSGDPSRCGPYVASQTIEARREQAERFRRDEPRQLREWRSYRRLLRLLREEVRA